MVKWGDYHSPDWYLATRKFVQGTERELHLSFNEQIWNEILRIIEGTFIVTKYTRGEHLTGYQNPSVFDFLLEWVKSLSDVQEFIIRESYFAEQLYKAFSDTGYPVFFDYGRLKISDSVKSVLEQAFKRHVTNPVFCTLKDYGTIPEKEPQGIADFLLSFERSFGGVYKTNPDLISEVSSQDLLEDSGTALSKRMDYLDKIGEDTKKQLDLERLAGVVLKQSERLDDFVNSMDLLLDTETGSAALTSDELLKRVEEELEFELEAADSDQACVQISDNLSALVNNIPGLNEAIWQGAIDEVRSRFPTEDDYNEDFSRDFNTGEIDGRGQYDEMFTSLLESCGD